MEIWNREVRISDIQRIAQSTDWESVDGKFALFHLLAAATWTSRPCRVDMPLSSALASLFESVEMKNHHIRPIANSWANWGASGILRIFESWNSVAAPGITNKAASAHSQSLRAIRRREAITTANAREPNFGKRCRLPRPSGSRLPDRFRDFVVDSLHK